MTRRQYFRLYYQILVKVGMSTRAWNYYTWQLTEELTGGKYKTYSSFRTAKTKYHANL